MFLSSNFDLVISANTLSLTDRQRNRAVTRTARDGFSSETALVADMACFAKAFRSAVIELLARRRLFLYPTVQISTVGSVLSPAERRAVRDALIDAGCRKVVFTGED